MPTKRPCQKNSSLERKQVEKSSLGQDPEGRQLPVYDWSQKRILRKWTRWCLSPVCSEPRPTKLLVADEILTFLGETAFENEKIDKGDGSSGHCTEHVGVKSAKTSLGQATSQALLTGSSKTTVRYLCSRLTWNMAWNAWRMLGDFGQSASQFRI